MRQKILLGGGTNTGKSLALIHLAVLYPNNQVWIFDPEGEIPLILDEMNLELPNLTVKPVTPDWEKLYADYLEAKEVLTPDDWCCFDMLGVFWDLAQNYFSMSMFGETHAQHLISLKKQAQSTAFGGFDGIDHWPTIKRLHNEDLLDNAARWSPFNVAATTSLADYSPKAKLPKTGVDGLIAQKFGKKLEGEKHNLYRFRNIVILFKPYQTNRMCFNVVKAKGVQVEQPLVDYDFAGAFFWQAYATARGVTL